MAVFDGKINYSNISLTRILFMAFGIVMIEALKKQADVLGYNNQSLQ